MTPTQIRLVQDTWAKVAPIADQAAALFYGRLFELDPELKPLFKSNIEEQGRKLMQMISMAVGGLGDLGKLIPAVENLGRRHVGYNVRMKDYDTVGTALLWTLEKGLREAWNSEVSDAWTCAYTTLADTMKKAAGRQLGAAVA